MSAATWPTSCLSKPFTVMRVGLGTSNSTPSGASTAEKSFGGAGGTVDAAKQVGKLVGERAKDAGVDTVVFDRGGNRYHGRVAGIADGAREAGLTL